MPQFSTFMATGDRAFARGHPTGCTTGVRSASVAAITSHHSHYWLPPIGVLLNLKHSQLFMSDDGKSNVQTEPSSNVVYVNKPGGNVINSVGFKSHSVNYDATKYLTNNRRLGCEHESITKR